MDYDRLRELQAKFDENPRRYFAPLANEYRKGGNPKRAIEICRAHLAQMPGHMSGQVVYGQSLFEGGEYDEARKVFEGALVLDPENLIALRSLGDLSLQAGNTAEARTWYTRLLEAEPKDAAVIALVSEIDSSIDAEPSVSAAETPGVGLDGGDEAIPTLLEMTSSPESPSGSEFTVDFSFVDPPPGAPSAEASSAGESSTSEGSQAAGEISTSEGSQAAGESSSSEGSRSESETAQIEPTGSPSETAGVLSEPALGLEHHYPTGDSVPVAPASSFAGTNPEPFVNETMAQLYLQQGYRQLALRVYRQLSERKPEEQSFKDRIAEIEASQAAEGDRPEPQARREAPPSIESPTPEPAAPRAPSTESPLPHGPGGQPDSVESPSFDPSPIDSPPTSSPSSEPDSMESPVREEPRAEPEGIAARQPSMREFFATLGRRRPPRPAPAAASTSWGRNETSPTSASAADNAKPTSLDAVFAGAKVSATDARAASTLAGAFSASARGTSPPSPVANPTPRANPRLQAHESEEDVAKFRAWLDGLTGE